MIGVLLLLIALVCYFKPKQRWASYFLYTSFMVGYGGGFGLWTNMITGIKNGDLAVIYTFVISVYLLSQRKYSFPQFSFIRQYKWLIGFLACSVMFSLFYYNYGVYNVLQGSRSYLLFFSLPILCRITKLEFDRLMRAFMWITTITAVLYIGQVFVGHPLMPYGDGTPDSYKLDSSTGLVRLYNKPEFNVFFLALTFVYPAYFGKKINIFRVIYFAALMCTMGRTGIFTGLMTVLLAMFFNGKTGRVIKTVLVLGILLLPFVDMLSNRFEKGETGTDIQTLLRGGAVNYESSADGGTMTYRIAWCMERMLYLEKRSVGEQIFGLGLITDSCPLMKYSFKLGLFNKETSDVSQMETPDIAYGNLISHWGFGGTIVYMIFVFSLILFFYKHRRVNPYFTVCSASSVMMVILSFAGTVLSSPSAFIIYFIISSTLLEKINLYQYKNEGNTY